MIKRNLFRDVIGGFALLMFAMSAWAQIPSYEPGNEPDPSIWVRPGTHQPPPEPAGTVPPIDVEMDPLNNAPLFQAAHSGTYTDGAGNQIIYQHLINESSIVTVLLPDGRWASGFGGVDGQSQRLLDLYVDDALVGQLKIGTVATTGSPPPSAKAGAMDYLAEIMGGDLPKAGVPCGRLIARARLDFELVFPVDPNLNCSTGPATPGTYCLVGRFDTKFGTAGNGPETCDLSR